MRATIDRLLEHSDFSLDDLVAKTALNEERKQVARQVADKILTRLKEEKGAVRTTA